MKESHKVLAYLVNVFLQITESIVFSPLKNKSPGDTFKLQKKVIFLLISFITYVHVLNLMLFS